MSALGALPPGAPVAGAAQAAACTRRRTRLGTIDRPSRKLARYVRVFVLLRVGISARVAPTPASRERAPLRRGGAEGWATRRFRFARPSALVVWRSVAQRGVAPS
eukprot:1195759-Prorocentrum_minimum.AAC.3